MSTTTSSTIVQRVWNYCNVLRDDGVSYGDYLEQLTYLLFLKMDDENVRFLGKPSVIPTGLGWQSLLALLSSSHCARSRAVELAPPAGA